MDANFIPRQFKSKCKIDVSLQARNATAEMREKTFAHIQIEKHWKQRKPVSVFPYAVYVRYTPRNIY